MDRIERELQKLTKKERKWVKEILAKLQKKNADRLDIKKLKGTENIFRIRKGDIRIIYRTEDGKIFILAIERRQEDTYKI